MTTYEIDAYVEKHREEAISFLIELLQTPSPTGKELEISKVVTKWLEQDGLGVEVHALDSTRPNIISNWVGNAEGPRFLFNGHYDVFPPAPNIPRNPWSAEIIDGDIYACGSSDMKAGLAAGIMATKLLKRSGFQPSGTITISCDCDEEQGGEFGATYLISKGLLNADFGVCMEASEDLIITNSDGRIAWRITYRAESWHAGMRSNCDNAIAKAHRAIERLYRYDDYLKETRYFNSRDGGAILSITEISAGNNGETTNINPSTCSFSIDRRYTKGETIESATAELKAVLDELAAEDPAMEYEFEALIESPQLCMDENSSCIKAAIESYREIFGKEVTLGRRCGGGDTAKITTAYGFPLPQFGPGKFDQLCVPNEHVSINEYVNFIKVYMCMVTKLLGTIK